MISLVLTLRSNLGSLVLTRALCCYQTTLDHQGALAAACGTDLGCAATVLRVRYTMPGTDLRVRYAMSGTDLALVLRVLATQCPVLTKLWPYACAMRCPVEWVANGWVSQNGHVLPSFPRNLTDQLRNHALVLWAGHGTHVLSCPLQQHNSHKVVVCRISLTRSVVTSSIARAKFLAAAFHSRAKSSAAFHSRAKSLPAEHSTR
eukprot:2670287-Rhodomonas_salina.1